jgi:hypothetical protein
MARWNSWLPGSSGKVDLSPPMPGLVELRWHMVAVLNDCNGTGREAATSRLMRARSMNELWLARTDLYQIIARQHCESLAAQRINALIPFFEGWIPAAMLRPI